MCHIYSTIASIGPVGHIKGGGSIAAALAAACWHLLMTDSISIQIISVLLVFFIGVWVSNKLEKYWGKDSSKIVIDEVLGMMVSLLFLPISLNITLIAFILFRFFDITKVLGIRKAEQLPVGWGVMTDDLWSGVYVNLLLQFLVYYEILH